MARERTGGGDEVVDGLEGGKEGEGRKGRERTEEQETHVGELFISWQGPGGQ